MKLWRMRNLTLEGKVTVFKSLALSKIIYWAQALPISKEFTGKVISTIRRDFIWKDCRPKFKHERTCKSYEKGGLKDVDINHKIKIYNVLGLRSLIFHLRFTLCLIEMSCGKNFISHSNLNFKISKLKTNRECYGKIVIA